MAKVTLGICLVEEEYKRRLCAILMNYYRERFLLHIYSDFEEISREGSHRLDAILVEDAERAVEFAKNHTTPVICLIEDFKGSGEDYRKKGVIPLEKYQDVSALMENVMLQIGQEIADIKITGDYNPKCRVLGVYGLCENDLQLPFAMTLAQILSEQNRVLLLDLQENSGFMHYGREENALSLEDLLLMARSDKKREGVLTRAIGHVDKIDYVYPVENTEVLCEADKKVYAKLIETLKEELNYSVIIINFGARFLGFFEILNQCQQIYLMQRRAGSCQWREYEFMQEIERKGYSSLKERLLSVELPSVIGGQAGPERLVEQWKWNEFGDMIRKSTLKEAKVG